MVLKFGYDNTESENKLYITYKSLKYAEIVSKLLTEPRRINRPLEIELSKVNSAFGLKYQINLKNIFFFKLLNNQIFSFDIELSQRHKMSKLINYNINPYFKLSLVNNKLPLILSFKSYNIQPSRKQIFDNNRFFPVLASLLPYKVNIISLKHFNNKQFKLFNFKIKPLRNSDFTYENTNLFLYKTKLSFGSISGYQNFLKVSSGYKVLIDIPIYFTNNNNFIDNKFKHNNSEDYYFSIGINSENFVKKSFCNFSNNLRTITIKDKISSIASKVSDTNINHNKLKEKFHYKNYNHVITNFDCYSKLLGANILSREDYIDNGEDFYIHSINSIRLKNIKIIRDIDFINRIEPYAGIEMVYKPNIKKFNCTDSVKSFTNNITLICSLGISLKLQEYLYLDFMFKSWSFNSIIDHDKINKFRVGLEISANI